MEVFSFPDGSQLVREANGTVYVIPPSMGGASLVDCDQATEKLQNEQKAIVEALFGIPSVEFLQDFGNILPTLIKRYEEDLMSSWLYRHMDNKRYYFSSLKDIEDKYHDFQASAAVFTNWIYEERLKLMDNQSTGNSVNLSMGNMKDIVKIKGEIDGLVDDFSYKLSELGEYLNSVELEGILPDSLICNYQNECDSLRERSLVLWNDFRDALREDDMTLDLLDYYQGQLNAITQAFHEFYKHNIEPLEDFEFISDEEGVRYTGSYRTEGDELLDEFMTLCGFKAQELLDESPGIFWTAFKKNDGKVSIPEDVNGHEVDSINGLIFPPHPNNIKGKRPKSSGSCIVEIPSTVKAIQGDPFRGYSGKIIMNPSIPPQVLGDGFTETTLWNFVLIVPDEAVSAYKSAPVWSGFPTIRSFTQASVDGVTVDSDTDSSATYYTIDGKKACSPLKSGIYVKIHDGKAEKIMIR